MLHPSTETLSVVGMEEREGHKFYQFFFPPKQHSSEFSSLSQALPPSLCSPSCRRPCTDAVARQQGVRRGHSGPSASPRAPRGRPRGGAAVLKAAGGAAGRRQCLRGVCAAFARSSAGRAVGCRTMESGAVRRLDAAAFLGAWRRFDADGKWERGAGGAGRALPGGSTCGWVLRECGRGPAGVSALSSFSPSFPNFESEMPFPFLLLSSPCPPPYIANSS